MDDGATPKEPPKAPALVAPVSGEEPPEEEIAPSRAEQPVVPPRETPKVPLRAKDLKVVYEEAKARNKQLEAQMADLAKKTQELEKTGVNGELKTLTERLEKTESRRAELEREIAHLNYVKSEEYLTKYAKPYEEAWTQALAELKELKVTGDDGNSRAGNAEDLMALANLPLGEAWEKAKEMFGDAAAEVMSHRRTVRELATKQQRATEESRRTAQAREEQRKVDERLSRERFGKLWQDTNKELQEKFPKWFAPVADDPEGNTLLQRGYEEVDRFFNDPNVKPEDRVQLHARMRGKAANHDRMALRLRRANGQISELQKKLSAYEGSTPPGGATGTGRRAPSAKTWEEEVEAEIQAMDRP